MTDRLRRRWWNHLRALAGGYFWLPCPECAEYFGGHELRLSDGPRVIRFGQPNRLLCPPCAKRQAAADFAEILRLTGGGGS